MTLKWRGATAAVTWSRVSSCILKSTHHSLTQIAARVNECMRIILGARHHSRSQSIRDVVLEARTTSPSKLIYSQFVGVVVCFTVAPGGSSGFSGSSSGTLEQRWACPQASVSIECAIAGCTSEWLTEQWVQLQRRHHEYRGPQKRQLSS